LSQDGRVLIVRATKKLLDRIGPPSLGEGEHSTTSMGQWYATASFWKPLLPLPAGADDIAIAKAAARHGICLAPLSPMHLAPSPNQGLLLGSGRLAEHRIPGAVRTLPPRSRKPGHLIPSPPSGRPYCHNHQFCATPTATAQTRISDQNGGYARAGTDPTFIKLIRS
jgi:hypothetical protein